MSRMAVVGAGGRMGKTLVRAITEKGLLLAGGTETSDSEWLSRDIGEAAGLGTLGISITSSLSEIDSDLVIDFSRPEATLANIEICLATQQKMVIGTTGFDDSQKRQIQEAARDIAIVMAPNMSIGVNLCLKLVQTAAAVLGDEVDIEIFEAHHRHKVDAPSGTALAMGQVIADTLQRSLADCAVYGRQGITGERERPTIGFSTMRGGDIVGEHSVCFIGDGERVEIGHKASSRMNFAQGALRAAAWLESQHSGLFDMQDVLGLR